MKDNNGMGGILVEVWNGRLGCTTSPVQAEVIPRLVGLSRVGSEGGGCWTCTPSSLNTMISELVVVGMACIGTIGERIAGSTGGVDGEK